MQCLGEGEKRKKRRREEFGLEIGFLKGKPEKEAGGQEKLG